MSATLIRKAAVVLPFLTLLAAGESRADGTTTGTTTYGTSPLAATDFTMYFERYNGKSWIQMNTTESKYFFNRARCECATSDATARPKAAEVRVVILPATNTASKIQIDLQASLTNPSGDGRLYAGSSGVNCLDVSTTTTTVLPGLCTNLLNPDNYAQNFPLTQFSTSNRYESPEIPVAWLYGAQLNPTCGPSGRCDNPGNCSTVAGDETISFWARTGATQAPDANNITLNANLVGTSPTSPAKVSAAGGNNALMVNWTWPDGMNPSTQTTFLGLQLFCKRGGSYQVFADGTYKPAYMTAKTLCPELGVDASSYGEFDHLNPIYLCSDLLPSTTVSHRITGLQNGIWYTVGVAAIDRYGNVSAITDAQIAYGQPVSTVDFYTDYRDNGGQAQGGFCAFGGRRPSALATIGMAALALILITRRRRKGASRSAGLGVVLVAAATLGVGQVHAQTTDNEQPDAEDNTVVEQKPPMPAVWTGSERNFAIELRFGLYMPNVDSEFSGSTPRPNALMFGSSRRPMWQIEYDWEILQAFGTLSVGGTVGYWKENAKACLQASLQADKSQCPSASRSGDDTSLRLIPFAALVVYRLDEAAKRWKVPLVPYGKLGLNYTIWTVNNGDGNVPTYKNGGHGQGGTAGWQAAVGLSLQLDFIDPAAAREFDSESGVNHTYAFFELAHVDGAGLYRSDVLRVGDNTWFAGLMFEF